MSRSCKTCIPCCQEKSSSRTVSHPAVFTAVNFFLPKMEANLCRQTHPWCKYTEAKFSINKSVPSSGKQLHGCFYLLLSVSLIGVQKVSKFLMTAAFPIPACCMTFRYWKQMNNWKQSFDHATFRCFEACLRDLKRLLAPTRKQILQSILILTIFPLKIIKIYFCTSLIWQKKNL